jgi:DNA-binding MarR family transcriptional regulator
MTRATPSESARILEPLGGLIRQLTRLTGGADDGEPMTATQRIALLELFAAAPIRLNELAGLIGTSAATASRAVDGLVHLGLVERVPDEQDRRAVRIDLTRRGRRLVGERRRRSAAAFAPAVAELAPRERDQLVGLLERMTGALLSRPGASGPTRSPGRRRA